MLDLAPRDIERFFDHGISLHLQADDLQGIGEGSQRVAKLVGQHGQELILALAGLLQLLGLAQELHLHSLSIGDVGDEADRALDRARAVAKRIDGNMEPAVTKGEVSGLAAARLEHSREERCPRARTAHPRVRRGLSP